MCDDPGKYKKNHITNCVINRIMSILFSFQTRNFIKQTLKNHIVVLFLLVTLKIN